MTETTVPGSATRRVVAIVNPATRRSPGPIVTLLRDLAPAGTVVSVWQTTGAGTTTEIARRSLQGADLMIAVGGDGTVAAVASAIDGSGIPLGIVPAGSTNIIARELGIPTNARAAVSLLYGAHRRHDLDLGVCGESRFLHMAGAGLDSRLFAATNPGLKRKVGWLAYLPGELIPFRQSVLEQVTHIDVGVGCSLALGEILTPGRTAMGEIHQFTRLRLDVRARYNGRPCLIERARLEPAWRPLTSIGRHGEYPIAGTLYLIGDGWTLSPAPTNPDGMTWASAKGDDYTFVRLLGPTVQAVSGAMRTLLA